MSEVKSISNPTGPASEAAVETVAPQSQTPRSRPHMKRFILLVVVPGLIAAVAVYAYLQAGRYESTDNAYVKSDIVDIASEISGRIASVAVEENQRVLSGAELFRLDEAPFRISLARAAAAVSQAESDIAADKVAYRQALAELDLHRATVDFARAQYVRQQGLRQGSLGSVQDLEAAQYQLEAAQREIVVAQEKAATLLARLNGDVDAPLTAQARYQHAQAEYAQAELDLAHCVIYAPFTGMVKHKPKLGAFVERGVPIMAVVSDEDMWIEANFKETQLAHIRLEQAVEIEVDSYPGHIWSGRLQSISEATGAEFALLPPQNATGNWVKIVQRVPMKIVLDPAQSQPPLRVGMSSTVTVDTGYERSWRDLIPGS